MIEESAMWLAKLAVLRDLAPGWGMMDYRAALRMTQGDVMEARDCLKNKIKI